MTQTTRKSLTGGPAAWVFTDSRCSQVDNQGQPSHTITLWLHSLSALILIVIFFSVSLLGLHLSFFSQLVSDFPPLHVHLLLSAHSWVFLYYLMCTFPESWLLPDEPKQGRFVFPTLLSESVNYSKPCLVLNTAWYTALWLIPQPQVHSLFLAKKKF